MRWLFVLVSLFAAVTANRNPSSSPTFVEEKSTTQHASQYFNLRVNADDFDAALEKFRHPPSVAEQIRAATPPSTAGGIMLVRPPVRPHHHKHRFRAMAGRAKHKLLYRVKKTPTPVFLIPAEAFGISPQHNLDPFRKDGKMHSQEEWNDAYVKLRKQIVDKHHGSFPIQGTYLGFLETQSKVSRRHHKGDDDDKEGEEDEVEKIRQKTYQAWRKEQDKKKKEMKARKAQEWIYRIGPREGVSGYTNVDPFNPALQPLDYREALLQRRREELMANPLFQGTPMFLPPPGAYLGFLEKQAATTSAQHETSSSSNSKTPTSLLTRRFARHQRK